MVSPTDLYAPRPFVTFKYTNWRGGARVVKVRFCPDIAATRKFLSELLDTEVTT